MATGAFRGTTMANHDAQVGGAPPVESKYPQLVDRNRRITPQAVAHAEKCVDRYIESLLSEAQAHANQDRERTICFSHVDDASRLLRKGKKNQRKQVVSMASNAGLGFAVPEFFRELLAVAQGGTPQYPWMVICWFVVTLVTGAASIWALLTD